MAINNIAAQIPLGSAKHKVTSVPAPQATQAAPAVDGLVLSAAARQARFNALIAIAGPHPGSNFTDETEVMRRAALEDAVAMARSTDDFIDIYKATPRDYHFNYYAEAVHNLALKQAEKQAHTAEDLDKVNQAFMQ